MNSQSLRRWITAAIVTVSNWPLVNAWAEVNADQLSKIQNSLPAAALAKPAKARQLLVFSRTRGFRHGSIPRGQEMIKLLGEKTGAFTATVTEDVAYFEPEKLKAYDAVLMLNTTGPVFSEDQGQWKDNPAREQLVQADAALKLPPLDFRERVLANGLTVISLEDHASPTVAVQVWYRVGSKDDPPGRSGFALDALAQRTGFGNRRLCGAGTEQWHREAGDEGGIEAWLRLGEAVGLSREDLAALLGRGRASGAARLSSSTTRRCRRPARSRKAASRYRTSCRRSTDFRRSRSRCCCWSGSRIFHTTMQRRSWACRSAP